MARAVIITLAVFVALVGVAIAVIPKERMYVAIPIPGMYLSTMSNLDWLKELNGILIWFAN